MGRQILNDKTIAQYAVMTNADADPILSPTLQSDIDVARTAAHYPEMVEFPPAKLRDDEIIKPLLV